MLRNIDPTIPKSFYEDVAGPVARDAATNSKSSAFVFELMGPSNAFDECCGHASVAVQPLRSPAFQSASRAGLKKCR